MTQTISSDTQFQGIPHTGHLLAENDVMFGSNVLNQSNGMADMNQVDKYVILHLYLIDIRAYILACSILSDSTSVDSCYTSGVFDQSQAYPSTFALQESFSEDDFGIETQGTWTGPSKQSEICLHEPRAAKSLCDQCLVEFHYPRELAFHCDEQGHLGYACTHNDCDKKFARWDTRRRHERKHRDDAKRFPCKYCKKYRGSNGFKRRDHLMQHVRNYHHIGEDDRNEHRGFGRGWCPKTGCSHHQEPPHKIGEKFAFSTSTEYIKHRRTIHDESDFPCPQPGCDRINGKGYFRKADLRNHLRKVHGTDGALAGDRK